MKNTNDFYNDRFFAIRKALAPFIANRDLSVAGTSERSAEVENLMESLKTVEELVDLTKHEISLLVEDNAIPIWKTQLGIYQDVLVNSADTFLQRYKSTSNTDEDYLSLSLQCRDTAELVKRSIIFSDPKAVILDNGTRYFVTEDEGFIGYFVKEHPLIANRLAPISYANRGFTNYANIGEYRCATVEDFERLSFAIPDMSGIEEEDRTSYPSTNF